MDEVKKIVNDIKARKMSPVYFLMGEEPYYIDRIASYIEKNVLTEEEKGFNQTIMYGRDVSIDEIIASAKRFPMMADYQVVIVKEAQDLFRTIHQLEAYVNKPQQSTVLVICYKYKKIDKRKKLGKALKKQGVIFESKKLYENKVAHWITRLLKGKEYTITPKAAQILVEFLGNDLGKINNELEKLLMIIPVGAQINAELIEENIGISKDFNNFELQKALGTKDIKKAYRIINYFGQNPKDNPIIRTIYILHIYFSKVLEYHGLKDKSKNSVATALKVNPYFVEDYVIAARNFPMKKVSGVISTLRDIDLKSKGVGANGIAEADLLKELLVKIAM